MWQIVVVIVVVLLVAGMIGSELEKENSPLKRAIKRAKLKKCESLCPINLDSELPMVFYVYNCAGDCALPEYVDGCKGQPLWCVLALVREDEDDAIEMFNKAVNCWYCGGELIEEKERKMTIRELNDMCYRIWRIDSDIVCNEATAKCLNAIRMKMLALCEMDDIKKWDEWFLEYANIRFWDDTFSQIPQIAKEAAEKALAAKGIDSEYN